MRKTKLYDNCKILAPDGQLLSTCSVKKLNWYVSKGLGQIVPKPLHLVVTPSDDGSENVFIQLNFEPQGRIQADELYYVR